MKDGYQEYKLNQVETADPRQLIVMLYDGALKFLDIAEKNIEDFKKYDLVNRNILRAQDIITELMVSLDMDKGGEIASNLMSLYSYMKKELLQSNMKKEKDGIVHVVKILKELKSAWEQIDVSAVSQSTEKAVEEMKSRGFVAQG